MNFKKLGSEHQYMGVLYRFFDIVNKVKKSNSVYAHCDIPCGIYDPHNAQVAALSVIRMVNLINEDASKMKADAPMEERAKFVSQVARYTKVKEEHAELVKKEVRIIWGDYIKPEHLQQHPELNDLVFKIMKLGSKSRQEVNLEAANELLDNVNKFAEIFWKTKGMNTQRVKAPSPSGGEIVVPKG